MNAAPEMKPKQWKIEYGRRLPTDGPASNKAGTGEDGRGDKTQERTKHKMGRV